MSWSRRIRISEVWLYLLHILSYTYKSIFQVAQLIVYDPSHFSNLLFRSHLPYFPLLRRHCTLRPPFFVTQHQLTLTFGPFMTIIRPGRHSQRITQQFFPKRGRPPAASFKIPLHPPNQPLTPIRSPPNTLPICRIASYGEDEYFPAKKKKVGEKGEKFSSFFTTNVIAAIHNNRKESYYSQQL